eukprot:CAMPEP_0172465330 /NCGR_PEP_ID=MMETSP1065-20121228/53183_1 /TAXON_ID=265537 /ORGANISM="Amphiprora paludosa, Strain CCMP125" /LENGTH=60 /DNA_ID=CAMNT_0013221827 /DNA_START=18 /DNA_END=196 /DNA_ORIENTATION=+
MAPSSPKSKKEDKKKAKLEYNPHWKGYLYIFITSLINLSAASNVSGAYRGSKGMAVSFGG